MIIGMCPHFLLRLIEYGEKTCLYVILERRFTTVLSACFGNLHGGSAQQHFIEIRKRKRIRMSREQLVKLFNIFLLQVKLVDIGNDVTNGAHGVKSEYILFLEQLLLYLLKFRQILIILLRIRSHAHNQIEITRYLQFIISYRQKFQIKISSLHTNSMQETNIKKLNQSIAIDTNTLLGKGSTGNVYQGINQQPHPHSIAIKAIPLQEINNQVTKYLLQCQLQALKITSKINNQSIVKLEEIIVRDGYCYVATQLLQGGTLKDYIGQQKKLSPATSMNILRKLLQGYKILKDNGIIHRDLKPENVLFQYAPQTNTQSVPKIIDFGYCIVNTVKNIPKMFYNVGSPRYMSPQAYTNNKYSQKSDIWALGIIFYEMLTGTTFDKGKNILQTFKLIKEKGIPIPSTLNNKCRSVMQHMLMLDPNSRYSCEQVLKQIRQCQHQLEVQSSAVHANERINSSMSLNKNLKQLRSTIINQRRIMPPSPNSRSPDPRASLINSNSSSRANGFLTRSLGFVVSPVNRDNRMNVFNHPNHLNFKVDKISLQNRSFNEEYRQGPLSDRNNRDNERPINSGEISHHNIRFNGGVLKKQNLTQFKTYLQSQAVMNVNRSLQQSTSQQNLRKTQGQSNNNKQGYHNTAVRNQREFFQNGNQDKQIPRRLFDQPQYNEIKNENNMNRYLIPYHDNEMIQVQKNMPTLNNNPFHNRISMPPMTPMAENQNVMQNNQRVNFIKPSEEQRSLPNQQIHIVNSHSTQHQQQHLVSQFPHQQFSFSQNQPNSLVQKQPSITLQISQPQPHIHIQQQVNQPFQSVSQKQTINKNSLPQSHLHFVQHQIHGPGTVNSHTVPTQVHFQSFVPMQDKNLNNPRIMPVTPQKGQGGFAVRSNRPEYNFLQGELQIRPKFIEQTHI